MLDRQAPPTIFFRVRGEAVVCVDDGELESSVEECSTVQWTPDILVSSRSMSTALTWSLTDLFSQTDQWCCALDQSRPNSSFVSRGLVTSRNMAGAWLCIQSNGPIRQYERRACRYSTWILMIVAKEVGKGPAWL